MIDIIWVNNLMAFYHGNRKLTNTVTNPGICLTFVTQFRNFCNLL